MVFGVLRSDKSKGAVMTMHELRITYPNDLLLSLKETPSEFEAQARVLLAVKLYELGKVTTGMAAQLAGMSRVSFIFTLKRFGLSPLGVDPQELNKDFENA
jgi:predicted HTH domain antitoxin